MDIKIFLAGLYTFGAMPGQASYEKRFLDYEKAAAVATPHLLESYHYVGKPRKVAEIRATGRQVFLDSGAFSAKSLGITITIEEYCQYIKDNEDIILNDDGILVASVLDEIGDPYLTYVNQCKMEGLGVRPLPCFHQGEDERYLEHYVANYDYITVGGIVGGNPKQLEIWLDRIWSKYLTDGAGNAKVKVHGFGMTSIPLMERYPWYSCDSSSWVQTASFGGIQTPKYGVLSVSDRSLSRHVDGQHLTTLSEPEKLEVRRYIEAHGFDPQRLMETAYGRYAYNIWAYARINEQVNEVKATRAPTLYKQELF